MSEHENYLPVTAIDLKSLLGHVLLGPMVQTPVSTLAAIAALRDALDYLEARYARQIAAAREQQAQATEPPRKKAAATPPARKRRGRPPGNGADRGAPPPLPFAGEDKQPSEAPAAEL